MVEALGDWCQAVVSRLLFRLLRFTVFGCAKIASWFIKDQGVEEEWKLDMNQNKREIDAIHQR